MPMPRSALRSKKVAPAPPPRTPRTFRIDPQQASAQAQNQLSLVASYDELVRNFQVLNRGSCEKEFLTFVQSVDKVRKKWRDEKLGLQKDLSSKEHKIRQARKLLEDERRGREMAEKQLTMLKDLLLQGPGKSGQGRYLDDETWEKIRNWDTASTSTFVQPFNDQARAREGYNKKPMMEESVDSILDVSDLCFEKTELMEDSKLHRKRRSSAAQVERECGKDKRRKSRSIGGQLDGNQILKTSTYVTVEKGGETHAESFVEVIPVNKSASKSKSQSQAARRKSARKSRDDRRVTYDERVEHFLPSAPPMETGYCTPTNVANPNGVRRHFSNASGILKRPHVFVDKERDVGLANEKCTACDKRIKFMQPFLKCRECSLLAHVKCRSKVPMPCVGGGGRTPTNKTLGYTLAEYAPREAPMIPALLIQCVAEIERRGLDERGLYRVPGSESEANELMKLLLNNRGAPMAKYEVHALASTIKKFLRSLKEPVIPHSMWRAFADAATNPDTTDCEAAMYQAVSELPRPNRDTLAFLVLHLQKVADNHACQMPADNLAMVMGPTVVGYSSNDPAAIMAEGPLQKAVMKVLLAMSSDYWANFIRIDLDTVNLNFNTPENVTPTVSSSGRFFKTPITGGIAKRTRSRSKMYSNPPKYFQSPALI